MEKVIVSEEVANLLDKMWRDNWDKQYLLITHCKGYSGNGVHCKQIYTDECKALESLTPLEFAKCLIIGYEVKPTESTPAFEYIFEDKQFDELSGHTTVDGLFEMLAENKLDGVEDDEKEELEEELNNYSKEEKIAVIQSYGYELKTPTAELVAEYMSTFSIPANPNLKFCNRCHTLAGKSVVEGYTYECTECDEDLYLQEVYSI